MSNSIDTMNDLSPSNKPKRPSLPRINTGDRIGPKIIEPSDDHNDNYIPIKEPKQYQDMLTAQVEEFFVISPTDSSSIDISVRDLTNDESNAVLVALVNREIEMRDLFIKNIEYFEMVKHSIFSSEETTDDWQEFLKILYTPRSILPDLDWMNKISGFLEMNPQLLANFKEIVGFYDNVEDHMTASEINEEEEEVPYTLLNEEVSDMVDITEIRDKPEILENILKSYPQFFINAQQALSQVQKRPGSTLGGNHLTDDIPLQNINESTGITGIDEPTIINQELDSNNKSNNVKVEEKEEEKTLYDEFKNILICPRSEMSDDEWEIAIYECLDPWPQLVAQFEEIVSYEIRND